MVIVHLDPSTNKQVEIKLYRNVKNMRELRQKVMSGLLECCLVNPKFIFDPFQLIVAANKAIITENRTTKTVFTEILFNLSISKNITKSLQQFGVTDNCSDLLVVTILNPNTTSTTVSEIQGEETDLEVLQEIRNLTSIKQVYKIKAEEEKTISLLDSIVSRIATKDFIAY